jgi:DNA modification methylase
VDDGKKPKHANASEILQLHARHTMNILFYNKTVLDFFRIVGSFLIIKQILIFKRVLTTK